MFSAADLDTILEATGELIDIKLNGVTVKSPRMKFRKDYESVSPYESNVGILHPAGLCKTSDLAGITNAHVFVVQGVEYKYDGKPEDKPSGFTLVKLGAKK